MNNGQDTADTNFQAHWRRFINETDLNDMVNYGLNTVRIPLGYWLKESLVDSSEHFPKVINAVSSLHTSTNHSTGWIRLPD